MTQQPTPLTADDASKLSDMMCDCEKAIHAYRIDHRQQLKPDEWDKCNDLEQKLLNQALEMETRAVGIILSDAAASLAKVKDSVENAKSVIKNITNVKQAIQLATALINLAASLPTNDISGIINSLGKINNIVAKIG